jgi:SAM-dependent methyltransferase
MTNSHAYGGDVPPLPGQAEVYNAVYGGKDHRGPDAAVAAKLLEIFPGAPDAARAAQEFLRRAVRVLAKEGLWQFIDLGSGYPAAPYLHDVATAASGPGIRMVYVDYNPVVCSHLRALCRAEGVAVVQQDLRFVDAVLDDPGLLRVINRAAPAVVIMGAVMHFLPDEEVVRIVALLRKLLAPGSLMVFSVATRDDVPFARVAEAAGIYAQEVGPVHFRTRPQVIGLLAGCELLPPGLVKTHAWRPDTPVDPDDLTPADDSTPVDQDDDGPDTPHLYAGVAAFLPRPRGASDRSTWR